MKKQMIWTVLALALLSACGGGCPVVIDRQPPPPPPPNAGITASGDGSLVLHPSLNPAYAIAMETPIRIIETAGGSADWNFARMSLLRGGNQIERSEVGATALRSSGFGPITSNSSRAHNVVFRFNSSDFDDVQITLGFGDAKDARKFTVPISLQSFIGVNLNLTPLSLLWSKLPMEVS